MYPNRLKRKKYQYFIKANNDSIFFLFFKAGPYFALIIVYIYNIINCVQYKVRYWLNNWTCTTVSLQQGRVKWNLARDIIKSRNGIISHLFLKTHRAGTPEWWILLFFPYSLKQPKTREYGSWLYQREQKAYLVQVLLVSSGQKCVWWRGHCGG